MPISRVRFVPAVVLWSITAICGSVKTDAVEKEPDGEKAAALVETIATLQKEVTYLRNEVRNAQEARDKSFAKAVELMDKLHQLSAELAKERARAQGMQRGFSPDRGIPAPDLEGIIVATSDEAMVEISVGSDDGLRKGRRLQVFRGDPESSVHLGEIEVVKTDSDRAICRVISQLTDTPIRVRDRVTTKGGATPPRRRIVKREPVSVQVRFAGPKGMQVSISQGEIGGREATPLTAPATYNFHPGRHDLKLAAIPGRSGVQLFPSLEIPQSNPEAAEFLEHTQIPIQLTDEDLDQALSGNFVTKVVFLPDLEFQELALAGVETLVSTRVDPGVDPVKEAERRGTILAILRLGNKEKDTAKPGKRSATIERGAGSGKSPRGQARSTVGGESRGNIAELVWYASPRAFSDGVSAQAMVSHSDRE